MPVNVAHNNASKPRARRHHYSVANSYQALISITEYPRNAPYTLDFVINR